jgi:hypothetical protein
MAQGMGSPVGCKTKQEKIIIKNITKKQWLRILFSRGGLLKPHLDRKREFIFIFNPKTASKSMSHGVLEDRYLAHNKQSTKIEWHKEINDYTDTEIDRMFKFTFVRNPWDRAVSGFFFLRQTWQRRKERKKLIDKDETFEHFVLNKLNVVGPEINAHFAEQHPCVFWKSKQYVHFVGRFENLQQDWRHIALQIHANPELPHINYTDHKKYKKYYTKKTKQIIAEIYKKDIELFNYKF